MESPIAELDQAIANLKNHAESTGLDLGKEQIEATRQYLIELYAYNQHTNLVADAVPTKVVAEHILDALSLLPVLKAANTAKLIDIGSGAGFPGLILAIFMPELKVTAVDSVGKKTKFLAAVVNKLGIGQRVSIINDRAETLAHRAHFREKYDAATARAVGKIDLLTELALPFLQINGLLLVQKSKGKIEEEILNAKGVLTELGGTIKDMVPVIQTGKDHIIIVIEKLSKTPSIYPRAISQMKKRPIIGQK